MDCIAVTALAYAHGNSRDAEETDRTVKKHGPKATHDVVYVPVAKHKGALLVRPGDVLTPSPYVIKAPNITEGGVARPKNDSRA